MPKVKCPTCFLETEYLGNDFRPFCSERCKLIDFGEWADGNFRLPDNTSQLSEEDFRLVEDTLKEKEWVN